MSYPDKNEAIAERQWEKDRRESKWRYNNEGCWGALDWKHDWRYATSAPGWKLGDDCVICQNCQARAIATGNREIPE